MKRRLFIIPVVILVLLVVLVPTFADMGKGESMNKYDGKWLYLPPEGPLDPLMTNPNGSLFFLSPDSGDWNGTIEGISVDNCFSVLHAAGRWVGYCTASFASATVGGKTGGLELGITLLKTTPPEPWVGEWFITSATGDLQGLEGEGTLWGPGYNPENPGVPGIIYYKVKNLKD